MLVEPRPPFRLDLTVWALRRQKNNRIDRWDGQRWRRALALDDVVVQIEVEQRGNPEAPALEVNVVHQGADDPSLRTRALAVLRHLLGLDIDLSEFYGLAANDSRLSPLVSRYRGLKPQRFADLFEAMANAVACQQISLSAGIELVSRLAERYGKHFSGELTASAFPHAIDLLGVEIADLRALGWSRGKASYLLNIVAWLTRRRTLAAELELSDDETVYTTLRRLRGIGRWSAEYTMLRGLGRISVFPVDDLGARRCLAEWMELSAPPGADDIQEIVRHWRPYAGLVYFHLLLWRLEKSGVLRALNSPVQAPAAYLKEAAS